MRLAGQKTARTFAKRLRKQMTPPEVLLWIGLRANAERLRFRRQHAAGLYVLDFYCAPAKLAIEVDGAAHDCGDRPARDVARDAWLADEGVQVVRYPATDVTAHVDGIVAQIVTIAIERMRSFRS